MPKATPNYAVFIEHSDTQMLASPEGWTRAFDRALAFTQGAHAIGYCLAKNYADVNLLYQHDARIFMRISCFNGGKVTKVVPAPGVSPGTLAFGKRRS